jgi:uncharacterized damage-inducible protein DinB
MDPVREYLLKTWDEAWEKSTWWPAFSVVFQDLTPQQAAWKPAPARHSIWQILHHMCLWREVCVQRVRGEKPPDEELERRNWEEPADVTDQSWRQALARFERSQRLVREALADESVDIEKLRYLLPHDAHHVGQVTYLRALQGLPPHSYG